MMVNAQQKSFTSARMKITQQCIHAFAHARSTARRRNANILKQIVIFRPCSFEKQHRPVVSSTLVAQFFHNSPVVKNPNFAVSFRFLTNYKISRQTNRQSKIMYFSFASLLALSATLSPSLVTATEQKPALRGVSRNLGFMVVAPTCEDTEGYELFPNDNDVEVGYRHGNCKSIRETFDSIQRGENVEYDWTELCTLEDVKENCCASCNDFATCKDTQCYEFAGPEKEGNILLGRCEYIHQTFESMKNGETVELDWTEYCKDEDVKKNCCASCKQLEVDLPDNTSCWHLPPPMVNPFGTPLPPPMADPFGTMP